MFLLVGFGCIGKILVFSKFFPLVPLFDVKEGEVFRDEIKVGRRTVPASIRE